jgi:hypothetical protein
MSAAEPPIMLRASITRAEYDALRIEAIRQNSSTTELVARALRATYNLDGETK